MIAVPLILLAFLLSKAEHERSEGIRSGVRMNGEVKGGARDIEMGEYLNVDESNRK